MEIQVNVDPTGGEKEGSSWVNSLDRWYPFRLPPDGEIHYDLTNHAFAIGATGWNYAERSSHWVGYDLDSIVGHRCGLQTEKLQEAIQSAETVQWCTIIRSTSGKGYHIYVNLVAVEGVKSHHEHSQLAKSILAKASAISGYPFEPSVDACGTILWLWHKNAAPDGFELLHQGKLLDSVPDNWRERNHATTLGKQLRREFSDDAEQLDEEHLRLIHWLERSSASWWWDAEKSLLVCHTFNLAQAHKELNFRGTFTTSSSGQSGATEGSDHNAFAVPITDGGWLVRRFGKNTTETDTWVSDSKKFTTCYYNTFSSLNEASQHCGGIESCSNEFSFKTGCERALKQMGIDLDIPAILSPRPATIKDLKDRVQISFPKESTDGSVEGFSAKGTKWIRICRLPRGNTATRIRVPHDKIRHVVLNSVDSGWFIHTGGVSWIREPRTNARDFLSSLGYGRGIADLVLGRAIAQHWQLVNNPFQPEYLNGRRWNKNAPQFTVKPIAGERPTWTRILSHAGEGLTLTIKEHEWCKQNSIYTGYDYLFLWCAWLFQQPKESLPYLFFYGHQNNGKSTFHEALRLFFTKGCIYADKALVNSSGFNGELLGAILCIIEETDLSSRESTAYNRIKDWVTGITISIHPKGSTPYDTDNYTHWIQCGNKLSECPIIPGDTRITACHLSPLRELWPKTELLSKLGRELPAMLYALTTYKLPPREGRLNIPLIETGEKQDAQEARLDDVQRFINEHCFPADGHMVLYPEFCKRISAFTELTKVAIGRALPSGFPKGLYGGNGQLYVGNLSFTSVKPKDVRLQRVGKRLKYDT